MEKTRVKVEVVSERSGARPYELEVEGRIAGPDAITLRFVPNDPNPHRITFRLATEHRLGRPIGLDDLAPQSQAPPPQAQPKPPAQAKPQQVSVDDPFSDSDDELVALASAHREEGQVSRLGDISPPGAGGTRARLQGDGEGRREDGLMDDVEAVKSGLPLDFMPVVFRNNAAKAPAAAAKKDEGTGGGLGRGRAAQAQPKAALPAAAQGPHATASGGFSASSAPKDEEWGKKEAPAAKPVSASLRAGLSGFSPPTASSGDAVADKMGQMKLGGRGPVGAGSQPLFPRGEAKARPVQEVFQAPKEESWDEEVPKPVSRPLPPQAANGFSTAKNLANAPAAKGPAPAQPTKTFGFDSQPTKPVGFNSQPTKPTGFTSQFTKPFGFNCQPAKPSEAPASPSKSFGSATASSAAPPAKSFAQAKAGSSFAALLDGPSKGAPVVDKAGPVKTGLGPEVRATWLAPKRVVTELLSADKPVLWAETQLQLGTAGMSEDREKHFHQPTAIAVNERNGDIIVADSQNRLVKVYKCSGTMRALIGNEDVRTKLPFHDPSGVVVINGETAEEDKVAVKCENGIHIITYDASGAAVSPAIIMTIVANGPHPWLRHPMGLALTAQRHLLTISNAKNTNASTEVVVVEPESGELVRRFPFRPAAEGPGCAPRFLDVWKDRLVVSDLGKNLVYVLSVEDGTELFRFGGPGRNPGKFSFASGVAVDGAGNILVGDAKANRIQLFDHKGTFLQVLHVTRAAEASARQQTCPFPAGVHLTAHGHLAFTSRGPQGQLATVAQLVAKPDAH